MFWSGQFEYMERATKRLAIVIPVTLILIVLILYLNTGSLIKTGIVLLAVPFSAIGAIWLVYLLGFNWSIAVWWRSRAPRPTAVTVGRRIKPPSKAPPFKRSMGPLRRCARCMQS